MGRTNWQLQINRLSLRNNRLKFKTSEKLQIIFEEPMDYTSNEYRKTKRSQHATGWTRKHSDLNQLCPDTDLCSMNWAHQPTNGWAAHAVPLSFWSSLQFEELRVLKWRHRIQERGTGVAEQRWWTCLVGTTSIIPFSACGTNSWSMHFFAKSQNWQGLQFFLSDTNFMNTCLNYHTFQEN